MGAVVMSPLPPVLPEEVQNSRAPSLHGHYPACPLLRARPPPSRLRPTSRREPVIRATGFRRFRGRTRRASPVARCVLLNVTALQTPSEHLAATASEWAAMLPSRNYRSLSVRR